MNIPTVLFNLKININDISYLENLIIGLTAYGYSCRWDKYGEILNIESIDSNDINVLETMAWLREITFKSVEDIELSKSDKLKYKEMLLVGFCMQGLTTYISGMDDDDICIIIEEDALVSRD